MLFSAILFPGSLSAHSLSLSSFHQYTFLVYLLPPSLLHCAGFFMWPLYDAEAGSYTLPHMFTSTSVGLHITNDIQEHTQSVISDDKTGKTTSNYPHLTETTLCILLSVCMCVALLSVGGAAALCYGWSAAARASSKLPSPWLQHARLKEARPLLCQASELCGPAICNPVTQQSQYDGLNISAVC